jgi:hypothetical protein
MILAMVIGTARNDRLRFPVIGVVLLCLLSGCFHIRFGRTSDLNTPYALNGDLRNVIGSTIKNQIDNSLTPSLMGSYPYLRIGRASCPNILDLTQGRKQCTTIVNGRLAPIDVWYDYKSNQIKTYYTWHIVDMSQAEQFVAGLVLSEYGVIVHAHCGDERQSIVPTGTKFRCSVQIENGRRLLPLTIKILPNGLYWVPYPKDLRKPDAIVKFNADVRKALARDVSHVPGAIVQTEIRMILVPVFKGQFPSVSVDGIHCPSYLDLSQGRGGVCSILMNGTRIEVTARDQNNDSIYVHAVGGPFDLGKVTTNARNFLEMRFQKLEIPQTVAIDCKSTQIIILQPPATYECPWHTRAGAEGDLHIIVDSEGRINYNFTGYSFENGE